MVDNLVILSHYDIQLNNEIKQLDRLAQQKNIPFCDVVYRILYKIN